MDHADTCGNAHEGMQQFLAMGKCMYSAVWCVYVGNVPMLVVRIRLSGNNVGVDGAFILADLPLKAKMFALY